MMRLSRHLLLTLSPQTASPLENMIFAGSCQARHSPKWLRNWSRTRRLRCNNGRGCIKGIVMATAI
jgi:hypothetical protein